MREAKNMKSKGVNIEANNFTNEEDDLIKKVTTIPKEHLVALAPVINDLVVLVSKKVTLIAVYFVLYIHIYIHICIYIMKINILFNIYYCELYYRKMNWRCNLFRKRLWKH